MEARPNWRWRKWAGLWCVGLGWPGAFAQPPAEPPRPAPLVLRFDALPDLYRDTVRKIIQQPTLVARPPAEAFSARPDVYRWLLDHPDRAAYAWRRIGVACLDITPLDAGQFAWNDAQAGSFSWLTVWDGPDGRVWYGAGNARPAPHLPTVPIKAVAVLRHTPLSDTTTPQLLRQQVDVFLQTDSKAAALAMRLFGTTAPRMAEQGASQLLLFFSALSGYLHQHPEQMDDLLAPPGQGAMPAKAPVLTPFRK
jgi:hypothetical protein